MATLLLGAEARESAKRRRREEYKQDLELQIKEKEAAKQRERLQGMSVNASGWLDPEKSPERFKPLGGTHWTEQRATRTDRVKPYHTLFLYGKVPDWFYGKKSEEAVPENPPVEGSVPRIRYRGLHLDTPAGLHYQPLTYATTNLVPNNGLDQAYNFYGTHDLSYGYHAGGGGSIVQPISMPYVDNRPIIVTGQSGGNYQSSPRYVFNPFEHKDDGTARELRSLLGLSNAEKDRMRRDNEDFQRRLREELEHERRKLNEQEADARRRMEELRREAEERRKEAERQRREAERARKEALTRPKTDPPIRPQSKKTMIYYDMDDYRQRLIDERRKIEELLKAGKPPPKDIWEVQIAHRPVKLPPPTPRSADRANRDNVRSFNDLKYRDFEQRNHFRHIFPDIPVTNRRLEEQQEALLREQESTLVDTAFKSNKRRPPHHLDPPPRRAVSRPDWMDRDLTPFPHVLKKRDRMYTAQSWDGDLDRITRRNEERDRVLAQASSRNEDAVLEELKLRKHRPASADTLTDDTWLRPSSTDIA